MQNLKLKRRLRNLGAIALGGLLFFLCGCASHRTILFGLYSVSRSNLPEARAVGVDFVVGPKDLKYLDAAKDAGLKVIGLGPKFFDHPALIGNYLTDEPDLFDVPSSQIAAEYKTAKRRSSKPVFLNLSSGYSVEWWARYSDVPMFDWYPVSWKPIETYWAHLRAARLAAGKKPFFAVVQTFDWSRYPKLMPVELENRPPTPQEVKAMAIWAVMNGASGVAFYPFDDGTTRLSDSPEILNAVKESIQFVRENEKYFFGTLASIPYPFSFKAHGDQDNAIFETSIEVRASIDSKNFRDFLLVAANTTEWVLSVSVTPKVQIEGVATELTFRPLEVKLLRCRLASEKTGTHP